VIEFGKMKIDIEFEEEESSKNLSRTKNLSNKILNTVLKKE
jgi:hypothetical protein